MSALKELRHVLAAHRRKAGAAQSMPETWVFNQIDANSVRRAAVLILFGGAGGHTVDGHSSPSDLDLLFVRRAETLRKHAGQIGFPGGGIDPGDDSPVAAALREAVEETGVDTEGIEVLGQLMDAELPITNFLVTPVIGWWKSESPVHAVDEAESAEVFRAPVAQLLDPRRRLSAVVHRGSERFASPAFDYDGKLIWGFTAIVLDRLFNELGWTRPWNADRELVLR
ncbi:NUDIX hydrolase [Glutamicibacter endophyticus]|uniref:NUDIX hydrolase n=1 Tax=Glutamicibacter endophyticus TaxID=1522174 RepID=UPI003AEF1E1F